MPRKTLESHSDIKRHSGHSSHAKSKIHLNGKSKPKNRVRNSPNYLIRHYLDKYEINSTLALSAAAMGLAGAVTYFLLNVNHKHKPKHFYDAYHEYKDEAGDFANNVYEKGKDIYHYATDYAENIKDKTSEFIRHPSPQLLLGVTGALALGGSLAYLLHRKNHTSNSFLDKFIESLDTIKESTSTFSENVNSQGWLQTLKDVIETIEDRTHAKKSSKSSSSFSIQNVIDLGLGGYKLWQDISKRK